MLSVYYDYQILLAQRYGGISRYFYELIPRLQSLGVDCEINCMHNHNYYFADSLGIVDMSKSNRLLRLAETGAYWYMNKFKALKNTRRKHYEIIHPTYYYMSYGRKSKIVLDVHDMIPERFGINSRLIEAKKKTLHEADRIISVSENTKRDLLEIYPDIDPEKVSVIYRGTMMKPQSESSRKFSHMSGRDYVLFVGMRSMYKNFTRFFEAVRPVLNARKDLHVFCAGGGAFTAQEREKFGEFSDRIFQAGLNDDELASAYTNALCFVFPSEYEGFGIPLLESFACGCPVVCSSSSSLPEVAGDAAEYFDPLSVDEMSAKIQNVIDDNSLRESLRLRGRERLKLFDWDKAARETLKCYEEALSDE